MGYPQVIMILLFGCGAGSCLVEHGAPKTGKNNAWTGLISAALMAALLWWGGFWDSEKPASRKGGAPAELKALADWDSISFSTNGRELFVNDKKHGRSIVLRWEDWGKE
jgi:LPXTG-motif cell wall-anchored protein